jgi:uncharacterized protein (DUF362 family)
MIKSSEVAITKARDYTDGTEDLFSLLKLESALKSVKKVLIKINLVRMPQHLDFPITRPKKPSPYKYHGNKGINYNVAIAKDGDVTRRTHVESLIKKLLDCGVEDITICEGAAGWDTDLAYKSLGYYELCEEYGVKIVDTNWAEPTVIPISNGKMLKDLWLAKEYVESDFRINLTTLKVHGSTCVSLCLKNWAIGVPSAIRYGVNRTGHRIRGKGDSFPIHQHYDREEMYGQGVGMAHTIADVNSSLPYELGIIDGMTTVHYGELESIDRISQSRRKRDLPVYETGLLFASFDRVAIDSVATRVMRLNPTKIYHIYLSAERGCGTIDLHKIQTLGERIEDVEMTCYPLNKQKEVMI